MLKIENIRKVFNPGTINEKVALDGVDLTLEETVQENRQH